MAKNFREIYITNSKQQKMQHLRIPDTMTEKVSCWTYSDMKREFQKSMELFAENGFEDECAELAYKTVGLSLFRGKSGTVDTITENIMAKTLLINTYSEISPYFAETYDRFISEYKNNPAHGLILLPEEQAKLDRDIASALEKPHGHNPEPPKVSKPKFIQTREISRDGWGYEWYEENFVYIAPPGDSDSRMKARLSDTAYRMMTEYERSEIASPDEYEKKFLIPNGLKMTDKLRDFFEVYSGRVFAWHKNPRFCMDFPSSQTTLYGYGIGCGGRILVSGDGMYYIEAMNEHTTQDYGLHIGSNGKVYGCAMGVLYFKADSMEEFLESEARDYRKDELLLERRRELENKYLIPEIRTASM